MARKLTLEARMTIKELSRRGWSNTSIAGTLGVTEGTVRYHRRRPERCHPLFRPRIIRYTGLRTSPLWQDSWRF